MPPMIPAHRRCPDRILPAMVPILLGTILCIETTANAAPTPGAVRLAGGGEALWIYRYAKADEDPQIIRFAYCALDKPEQREFKRARGIGPVTGEIAVAAVLREHLHAFYVDGSHWRYSHRIPDRPDLRSRDVQLQLPQDTVPLALAGNDKADVLYAVVPSSVVSDLHEFQADRPAAASSTTQPAEKSPSDTAGPELGSTELAEDMQPTADSLPPFAIVRFERGEWIFDRPAPSFLNEPAVCHLAAGADTLHLIAAEKQSGGGARSLRYTRWVQDAWSAPVELTGIDPGSVSAIGWVDESLAVVSISSAGSVAMNLVGESGVTGTSTAGSSASAVDAAVAGGEIAIAQTTGEAISVGFWSRQGGDPKMAPMPVTQVEPIYRPWYIRHLTAIAYGVLMVILIVVFVRRRELMVLPASLQPGQFPAPHSRRLIAFIIDMVIFLPVLMVIFGDLLPQMSQSADRMEMITADFLLRWMLWAALFSLYCLVTEGLMGATAGKRIVRLRVVNERGLPCGLGPVAVRNLMRLVEMFPLFDLMPAIVLILLTRNRQRLGDLIARTMVVMQLPLPPQRTPEEQPPPPTD